MNQSEEYLTSPSYAGMHELYTCLMIIVKRWRPVYLIHPSHGAVPHGVFYRCLIRVMYIISTDKLSFFFIRR